MAISSIYHSVPVLLQPKPNSCWYTSMQMVTRYCRATGRSAKLIDPSEDSICQGMFIYDHGMPFDEAPRHAGRIGYATAYMSPSPEGLAGLLFKAPVLYTGLWDALQGHWVVLNGISDDVVSFIDPLHGIFRYPFNRFFGGKLKADADTPIFCPKP